MSEQTPSQAEGERDGTVTGDERDTSSGHRDVPRTTPSQAEGEDPDEGAEGAEGAEDAGDTPDGGNGGNGEDTERSAEWQAGRSGP